ncbi:MAG: hypothetical protein ACLR7U_08570 [Ruthenibacterium lactatiformans]
MQGTSRRAAAYSSTPFQPGHAAEDTARFHREYRNYLSRVVLELTEVTRIDADLQAVKMQALMRSGRKLALDDYGSSYNGEAMLLAVQRIM